MDLGGGTFSGPFVGFVFYDKTLVHGLFFTDCVSDMQSQAAPVEPRLGFAVSQACMLSDRL